MSWLYSQALVAEFLEANSLDGEPCAQLNVMPTQRPFWRKDKTMDVLSLSPFGATWKPLTARRGEELLTWYLAGFHARTSALLDLAPASMVRAADCGVNSNASLARYDHDTHSWRTPQLSLLGGSELYSETWPRWGLMRVGECWELPTPFGVLELRRQITSAIECGSLERIPTPTGQDNNQVRGEGAAANHPARGTTLGGYVRRYPSPGANDWRSGKGWDAQAQKSRGHSPQLRHILDGMLNPEFAEWLMGWPIGWTALDPLVMDRCRNAQLRHGGC